MPEAFYLAGLRVANSRSAMVFALALLLSLVLTAALASIVTAPLRRMARATQAMARGDMSTRVPGSKLEELGSLADSSTTWRPSFKMSFDELFDEVETRKRRERELAESEARLRASEARWRSVFESSTLGIILTDHNYDSWPRTRPCRRCSAIPPTRCVSFHRPTSWSRTSAAARRRLDDLREGRRATTKSSRDTGARTAPRFGSIRLSRPSQEMKMPTALFRNRHRHHRPIQGRKRTAAIRDLSRRS